mmetsp:Transcript_18819/g.28025  ORF Transcript_18819/g.28025 Transcript_18819/m.28025 type:complete len:210 (-) Transcript_18819:3381-4010(-)
MLPNHCLSKMLSWIMMHWKFPFNWEAIFHHTQLAYMLPQALFCPVSTCLMHSLVPLKCHAHVQKLHAMDLHLSLDVNCLMRFVILSIASTRQPMWVKCFHYTSQRCWCIRMSNVLSANHKVWHLKETIMQQSVDQRHKKHCAALLHCQQALSPRVTSKHWTFWRLNRLLLVSISYQTKKVSSLLDGQAHLNIWALHEKIFQSMCFFKSL